METCTTVAWQNYGLLADVRVVPDTTETGLRFITGLQFISAMCIGDLAAPRSNGCMVKQPPDQVPSVRRAQSVRDQDRAISQRNAEPPWGRSKAFDRAPHDDSDWTGGF